MVDKINDILTILAYYIRTKMLMSIKSRAILKQYQQIMINKALKRIQEESPYFKGIDVSKGLKALPLMDKKIMMDKFDELNTVGIKKSEAFQLAVGSEKSRNFDGGIGSISVGLSSGTSGAHGIFLTSRKERNMWTGAILAKFSDMINWHERGATKIAFFLRSDNNLYELLGKNQFIQFRWFDPLKETESNVEELRRYNPTILAGPPSVLLELLKSVGGNWGTRINHIITVAEVLEPLDKAKIKRGFSDDIRQIYQCTEGFLGYTCRYGKFHLNEDIVYFEKQKIAESEQAKEGSERRQKQEQRFIPIITDFSRTSQPIIRYRLNDILISDSKGNRRGNRVCKCGSCFTVIKGIEGREDDIFKFWSNKGNFNLVTVFPDFISRCIIYVEGVTEYRVIQKAYNKIEVQLEIDNTRKLSDVQSDIASEFKRLADTQGFELPIIGFKPYKIIKDKKLKRIQSNMMKK